MVQFLCVLVVLISGFKNKIKAKMLLTDLLKRDANNELIVWNTMRPTYF